MFIVLIIFDALLPLLYDYDIYSNFFHDMGHLFINFST